MDPAFWGNSTWRYLHTLTFNYPINPTNEDKIKYLRYFNELSSFLPCDDCAKSYKLYMSYIPLNMYVNDIYGITYWLYIIHSIVNTKLSKHNSNFDEIVKMYLSNKTNCNFDIISNPSSKCTKNTSTPLKNEIYLEFCKIVAEKYLSMTNEFIDKLLSDYPSLK